MKAWGIIGIAVIFVAGLIGFIWFCAMAPSWFIEKTAAPPGDSKKYDAFASFQQVKTYASSNAQLQSIEANFVRSDGTMDLTATYRPPPTVEYKFVEELKTAPTNAPPLGAGRNIDNKWYQSITVNVGYPGQWRHVIKRGGNFSSEYSYQNQGMQKETGSPTSYISYPPIDPPKCTLKQLWDSAIQKDAPKDAVAVIKYDHNGYEFEIRNTDIDLKFDGECNLLKE
jgi:hypothetical protein